MTDIQFYHLFQSLERFLPKLLEKSLQGGFRTRVKLASSDQAEAMNGLLWTYSPDSFLPHGTAKDGYSEAQPIYLTAAHDDPNQADMVIVTDGTALEKDDVVKRLLDIVDGNDEQAVAQACARQQRYQEKGHNVTYVRQMPNGTWEKQPL